MGVWVQFSDVQAAYEADLDASKEDWVNTLIARAEALLARKRPNLAANIAGGKIDAASAKLAVITAILRIVRNPEGYQSETEGNYVYQKYRDVAGGKLYFDPDDLLLVTPTPVAVGGGPIRSEVPVHRMSSLRAWVP